MISVTIFETSTSYGISLPEYVKTVKQLKNNILSKKTQYSYNNLRLVLLDNNKNHSELGDTEFIYDKDIFILAIVPIILD